jgi:dihydroorotase
VIGLETAAAVVLDRLVRSGRLSLSKFAELFSTGPARIFGLPGGTLAPGAPADVTLFDPAARWTVEPSAFRSLARNSPFSKWELVGRPAATLVGGRIVWRA